MSKMVTLVPPCNPFNQINRDQIQLGKKSDKDPSSPPSGQDGAGKDKDKP